MEMRMPKPPSSPQFNKPQHAAGNSLKQNALKIGDWGEVPKSALGAGVGRSNRPDQQKQLIYLRPQSLKRSRPAAGLLANEP